ncbi:MAG: cytochrome c [Parvularculaceae bacterium]
MRTLLIVIASLLFIACGRSEPKSEAPAVEPVAQEPTAETHAGPPPIPVYSMRAETPAGDRLSEGRDGKSLYESQCGACHLSGGMGFNLLVKQRIAAGAAPQTAQLALRDDLTADYVKAVVRNGKMAMPPLSRVEVTDAELDSIAAFLSKGKE